jgi:hypothetical protein
MAFKLQKGSTEKNTESTFSAKSFKKISGHDPKLSINSTFGIDPIVYNEQTKLKKYKEGPHPFTSFPRGGKHHVDFNFNITNQGDVKVSTKGKGYVPRSYNNEAFVQPSFSKDGKQQKYAFQKATNFAGQPSNSNTFSEAQAFKDRIVKKQFVRDAMKTIYGDPKNNLINKYGKK